MVVSRLVYKEYSYHLRSFTRELRVDMSSQHSSLLSWTSLSWWNFTNPLLLFPIDTIETLWQPLSLEFSVLLHKSWMHSFLGGRGVCMSSGLQVWTNDYGRPPCWIALVISQKKTFNSSIWVISKVSSLSIVGDSQAAGLTIALIHAIV